jgi:molybdenum cofactor cytidylyltransferase
MIHTNFAAPPGLSVVVLAAGYSRRLGRPKVSARIGGTTLLQRTLRALPALARGRIVVVVPPRAVRIRTELRGYPVVLAENPGRASGLSSSVRRGLRQARYSAGVLLLPADLAHLERRDIVRLIERWSGARRRVVARRLGTRGAAPLILPRRLIVDGMRISGDTGLKDMIRDMAADTITLMDLPSASPDVDTPRDLDRARRHARYRPRARGTSRHSAR